ncbi:MAG: ExbD/TolR family protein [Paracoccaceae bacterium]
MKIKRRRRPEESETIVALIDVVFFLLVFFMLIGRMDATAPFDVNPPIAETGRDMPSGGLTLSVSSEGALAFEGLETTREELPTQIAARLDSDPDIRLRINAHKDAELRHVLPLVTLAESAGVGDVMLVVTPAPAPGSQ